MLSKEYPQMIMNRFNEGVENKKYPILLEENFGSTHLHNLSNFLQEQCSINSNNLVLWKFYSITLKNNKDFLEKVKDHGEVFKNIEEFLLKDSSEEKKEVLKKAFSYITDVENTQGWDKRGMHLMAVIEKLDNPWDDEILKEFRQRMQILWLASEEVRKVIDNYRKECLQLLN